MFELLVIVLLLVIAWNVAKEAVLTLLAWCVGLVVLFVLILIGAWFYNEAPAGGFIAAGYVGVVAWVWWWQARAWS
jgi:hypothetical protein